MTRLLAATACAPLAVVPILTLMFGPWAIAHGGSTSLLGIIIPALVVTYLLTLLVGLPTHLTLMRQGLGQFRHYATAGLLLGAVPVIGYAIVAIVFEAKFDPALLPRATVRNLEWGAIGVAVFGASSMAVALAFRAIARQRDDRATRRPGRLTA